MPDNPTPRTRTIADGTQRSPHPAAADLTALLTGWRPPSAQQANLRQEYLTFLTDHDHPTDRDSGPQHLTASCFVFTTDLTRILLTHHRKGGFWVQLGGHIEPTDATLTAAALREAHEEGGIADLTLACPVPVDLDRHTLGATFGPCHTHWDVGVAATAPSQAIPAVSTESHDVAWWPVAALPDPVAHRFAARLDGVLAQLRAQPTTHAGHATVTR